MQNLNGKKVAILAAEGFEQSELIEPRVALERAGAETTLISPEDGTLRGWQKDRWGEALRVDLPLEQAVADDFDALLLPGGVMNPDKLRMEQGAVALVKKFYDSGKPIAAICHGPVMLIEAGVLRGRTVTSYPSIKTDLINAGAKWVDQEVVTDGGLVTSRKPGDIPAFNVKFMEEIAEGIHKRK